MRYLLLMLLATLLVCGGCDDDTGPVECTLGEYSGDFEISHTIGCRNPRGIHLDFGRSEYQLPSCTELSELICLTSVGGHL